MTVNVSPTDLEHFERGIDEQGNAGHTDVGLGRCYTAIREDGVLMNIPPDPQPPPRVIDFSVLVSPPYVLQHNQNSQFHRHAV